MHSLSNKKCFLILCSLLFLIMLICVIIEKRGSALQCQVFHISGKEYGCAYEDDKIYFYSNLASNEKIIKNSELPIIDLSIGDIDDDGDDEILTLAGEENRPLAYFDIFELHPQEGFTLEKIYTLNMSAVKPWMIEVGEIDGDQIKDIFIGVYKSTYYYPHQDNRPFFFNYINGKLVKKWTGSKLRNSFSDACFADINNDGIDEFFVAETTASAKTVVAAYQWFGFGFVLLGETSAYDKILDIYNVYTKERTALGARIEEKGGVKEIILDHTNFLKGGK